MSKIRDAIGQLPSWPALAIGAALIVGIGGWYYGTTYAKCSEVRGGRERLHAAVSAAAAGGSVLDLASAVPGDWDEVRIVQGHNPGQVPLNCPFGWDMEWRERQALVEAGKYTIIGFFRDSAFLRYVEYRADWGAFANPPKSIARGAARFAVSGSTEPYALRLID